MKIENWKQEKDQREREDLTFSPKLCDKSLKKKRRTLEQMIQDLYVKPQSERGSTSKNRRVTSREGSASRRSHSGIG
jgi:hypothetical protein